MASPTTPSITQRGSVLPRNEPVPRTRILTPAPGRPEVGVTTTPATLPCSILATLGVVTVFNLSDFTEAIEPVIELLRCTP